MLLVWRSFSVSAAFRPAGFIVRYNLLCYRKRIACPLRHTQPFTGFMAAKRTFKEVSRHIIFDSNTIPSKLFDLALIGAISLSVIVVMLDSVAPLHQSYGSELAFIEWCFTLLFTAEYLMRLFVAPVRMQYARIFSASSICSPFSPPTSSCSFRERTIFLPCVFFGCSGFSGCSSS